MKGVLLKILRLIGKPFQVILGAKIVDLDNDGKIESIKNEITGLFDQFRQMSNKLEEANNQLEEVVEDEKKKQEEEKERLEMLLKEHERKIQESEIRVGKAIAEIDKNKKLKSKVDEFVV